MSIKREIIEKTLQEIRGAPVLETLQAVLERQNHGALQTELIAQLVSELSDFGPIKALMDNPAITEILVQGTQSIFYEKDGQLHYLGENFTLPITLDRLIHRILQQIGRIADRRHPLVDGVLPGGVRVHVALPPVTKHPTLSFRKHSKKPLSLDDLTTIGALTAHQKDTIREWITEKKNIIVCGPTSSGKTTFLGALLQMVPQHERIITLEDTEELQLVQLSHVSLYTRESPDNLVPPIDLSMLVKHALRMRPDRLVIGEIRGCEAFYLLDALATGHRGSLSSLHALSARQALRRLEALVLRAAPQWPVQAVRQMMADSIDVILVLEKTNGLRRVAQAARIAGVESFGLLLHPLF